MCVSKSATLKEDWLRRLREIRACLSPDGDYDDDVAAADEEGGDDEERDGDQGHVEAPLPLWWLDQHLYRSLIII